MYIYIHVVLAPQNELVNRGQTVTLSIEYWSARVTVTGHGSGPAGGKTRLVDVLG